ncbi:MAG: hypothetical protein JWM64_115, partial [Frankiales bacterium]|nr:hypothetical protein [Frankiales bacterium]
MRRSLLAAGTACLLLTAAPASADAADVQVLDVGGAPSGTLRAFTVERLVPGSTTVARFLVHRRGHAREALLASAVLDVRDLERGCGHAETTSGDSSCGDSEGELSAALTVAFGWTLAQDCSAAPLPPPGRTLLLAADDQPLLAGLPAGAEDACVVVRVDLPWEADNTTQSDAAVFALRLGVLPGAVPALGRQAGSDPQGVAGAPGVGT